MRLRDRLWQRKGLNETGYVEGQNVTGWNFRERQLQKMQSPA
jgi:hypothetical protein